MPWRAITPALVLLVAGCGERYTLSDVPIEGGTPSQRQTVSEELERFQTWAGEDRIGLSEIVFIEIDDAGFFRGRSGRVGLSNSLTKFRLALTLRHELCHAVDFQEGLVDRDEAGFDELVTWVLATEGHPLRKWVVKGPKRKRRAEAFAYLCQQAPLGTAMLADPCPNDADNYARAARWVHSQVWTADPDLVPATVVAGAEGRWEAGLTPRSLVAYGSIGQSRAAFLALDKDNDNVVANVDLKSGAEVAAVDDFDLVAGMEPPPAATPYRTGTSDWFPTSVDGAPTATFGERSRVIVPALKALDIQEEALNPRVLAYEEDTWSIVADACPAALPTVFRAGGEFYVAWAEGTDVAWSAID